MPPIPMGTALLRIPPEAGKVNGNTAQFTWKDSYGNTGTGTISLAGDDIVVSMKAVHVADPSCLAFYRQNMKLKRTGKK